MNKDYEEYIREEYRLSERKTNHGTKTLQWVYEDKLNLINTLLRIHAKKIENIVCHGCRSGLEVEVLRKLNPTAKVLGTDLYEGAFKYDKNNFRQLDFDVVPEEWTDFFDIVYSNSIDHSRNERNTILSWKKELTKDGIMFVTFQSGDPTTLKENTEKVFKGTGISLPYISNIYRVNKRGFAIDVIGRKS